jgi:hypothetical protein
MRLKKADIERERKAFEKWANKTWLAGWEFGGVGRAYFAPEVDTAFQGWLARARLASSADAQRK